jgi:hypothetical protein
MVLLLFYFRNFLINLAKKKNRSNLLESLISLFELPEDSSTPDDEHFIDVEDTPG